MLRSKGFVSLVLIALLTLGLSATAQAKYPVSNVTLITHSSPGAGTDVFLRNAIKFLGPIMGTNFVVENVRGGSGAKAISKLATSPADGSVFYGSTPTYLMTSMVSKTEHSYTDVLPVVNVFFDSMILYTNADSQFKTLKDAVDYAKNNPGKGKWGMGNPVSTDRKVLETLKKMVGIDKVAITSFEGGGDLMLSVLGGNFDFAIGEPAEVAAQVQSGKIRILGFLTEKRVDLFPNVPTVKEQGYDIVINKFRGIVGPKGLSKEVIQAWEEAVPKLLANPEYKKIYDEDCLIPAFMTHEATKKYISDYTGDVMSFFKEMGIIK